MSLKTKIFKSGLLLCSMTALLTACSEDNEFDSSETIKVSEANLSYNSDGIWSKNNDPGFISIEDYEFSHSIDEFDWVWGFTASKIDDNTEHNPGYLHPYAVMYEDNFNQSMSPYLVGTWDTRENADTDFDSRSCRIYENEGETFKPQSVLICNNTYAYYTMLNGNDYSKKFDSNDWLKLIINGVHSDGSEDSIEFYLAQNGKIVANWTKQDLTSLGVCTGIYFTMESSDAGQWGMNTPAYFCLNQLEIKD